MDGLCRGTTLSALDSFRASGEAPMGAADILTLDGRRFTLNPGSFGARFTLSTFDPPARNK